MGVPIFTRCDHPGRGEGGKSETPPGTVIMGSVVLGQQPPMIMMAMGGAGAMITAVLHLGPPDSHDHD